MITTLSLALVALSLGTAHDLEATGSRGVVRAGGPPPLRIRDCSLGCERDPNGFVLCQEVQVTANGELRIWFTQPLDPTSFSALAFSLLDVATGSSASGALFLEPADPRVLVFRPSLGLDSAGTPVFGLREGSTYFLRVTGTIGDAPPYLRSLDGMPNESPLRCTLFVRGVQDAVPGPPTVQAFVDVERVDPDTGEVVIVPDVPAQGATSVSPATAITFRFDDLMHPGTLVNPLEGRLVGISIVLDPDGNVLDPFDRVRIAGSAAVVLDPVARTTTVVFQPNDPLPRCGNAPCPAIVVEFGAVRDLAGNRLANPAPVTFEPAR